jgi:hypothetical protein
MKIRRQITGALCGLLGTYGSRYSDYDGYWLFGLLVYEIDSLSFDLLRKDPASSVSPVIAKARRSACTYFDEQIRLAHIPLECIAEAKLTIQKVGDARVGSADGNMSQGHQLSLVAEAVSDLGKKYRAEKFLFVAPHDPRAELRSMRREGAQVGLK